jgi:hypothetical protein
MSLIQQRRDAGHQHSFAIFSIISLIRIKGKHFFKQAMAPAAIV